MRKLHLILLALLMTVGHASSQGLTLEECHKMAAENYPVVVQRGLIEKSAEYNISNAKRNWLPQLSFAGQATYQSEVPTIPENLQTVMDFLGFGMDGIPKDQYKIAAKVEQTIWDGGLVAAQVKIAKAEGEVSHSNWEIEMYNLRERVNQLFFGALLLQENLRTADLLIDELNRNLRLVESYVANGVAEQNDIDQLRVEILSAGQQRVELAANLKAFRTMLELMTGRQIADGAELIKPETVAVPVAPSFENRPEIRLFEAQESLLNAQRKGINASLMPRVGAFAQGIYGRPGGDLIDFMIENKWSAYYVAGVSLQWNIGAFYTRRNKLAQIDLGYSQVASQRETFLYNMRLRNTQENIAIDRMNEVMRDDEEIIRLRNDIRRRTEVQVRNGTATVSDLLREINAENRAHQNKAAREVELLKSIYDLKNTINN